uniref:Ligand-gated ion channel 50 n=1 Tax=Strongyloides stercoralis TaxID=6248 RepID=A0A0K0ET68_STRER
MKNKKAICCITKYGPLSNFIFLLLLLISISQLSYGRRRRCQEEKMTEGQIVQKVLSNYTKMLPEAEDAVIVNVELHIQDMGSLNELTSDFEIDILFTQLWEDSSLSFTNYSNCLGNITMEHKYLASIWTPNTCLVNSKKTAVHSSPTENIMFILYDNGTVWINHRLSVKAPCSFELRSFPFDCQSCTLSFESYSHNNAEVSLNWMQDAITLLRSNQLPDFDMINFKTYKHVVEYPNGLWDQLKVRFFFKRRYGFYILQAYVPTYLTIIVSWVSFCMEPKALPARTTVGISSLLALTFQFGNILKNLPRASYVKAIDVWMLGCITFVFSSMIELALVCYITRCQSSNNKKDRKEKYNNLACDRYKYCSDRRKEYGYGNGIDNLPGSIRYRCSTSHLNGQNEYGNGNLPGDDIKNENLYAISRNKSGRTSFLTAHEGCCSKDTTDHQQSLSYPRIGNNTGGHYPCNDSPTKALLNGNEYYCLRKDSPSLLQRLPCEEGENLTFRYPLQQGNNNINNKNYGSRRKKRIRCRLDGIEPESIDKLSIVCFPLAFTLFNLIYWWHYLGRNIDDNVANE